MTEMRTQEKIFIEGCINNSLEKAAGQSIFNQMLGFAEYCFNKSHSTAYAFTTYQTAWLKSHWPVEFFSSLMSVNLTDFDKVEKYICQASSIGIFVHQPEINICDVFFVPDYTIENKSFINFGLGSIKNIGEIAASIIIADRKVFGGYPNLSEIVNRLINKQLISKKLVETLIICGCLDKLDGEKKRKRISINLDKIIEWTNRVQKIKYLNQPLLLDLGSLKKENKYTKKDTRSGNNTRTSLFKTKSEQTYVASNLTGVNNTNSILFKHAEIAILLGAAYSLSFRSSEFDNVDLIDKAKFISNCQKSKVTLNRIEKIRIYENYQNIEYSLVIAVILEIQEYKTAFQKIIKYIFEDFNGIIIGTIFEKNGSESLTYKKLKTRNNLIGDRERLIPGNVIKGYGIEDEWILGSRKLKLSWITLIHGSKVIVISISTDCVECFSIHLLMRLDVTFNSYFSKNNEISTPLIINVKGKNKNELIKTGLSLTNSNFHTVSQLFKKLGFECGLFQIDQI